MTSPPQPDLPTLVAQHDVVAAALEAAAVYATAGALRRQVDAALTAFLGRWNSTFGDLRTRQTGPDFDRIVHGLASQLKAVTADPKPALLEYARKAKALGVTQGSVEAGVPRVRVPEKVSFSTHTDIAHTVADVKQKLTAAHAMVAVAHEGSFHTVQAAAAPAVQAGNVLERAAADAVNTELNGGIKAVADHVGAQRLWVAERDACVVCLALSGHTVAVGHEFDMDATFGAKPLTYAPTSAGGLTGPPRHPHCRCRSTVWRGANDDTVLDYPTALRREAERSILRGDALPSESERVRTQAADRLLQLVSNGVTPSGWQVPKSVRTKAQAAVDRGRFNRK